MADSGPEPARSAYQAELDQLRLQVEILGVRVDENLERMRFVLEHGDERQAARALKTMTAGQALHRMIDHATVLGARLRYLFTGDPNHLAAEVR